MKVTVEFPQIMKMALGSEWEIDDEATVEDVKARAFADFWQTFNRMFPGRAAEHGSIEDITLKDGDEEISTDEMLRGKSKIQVLFVNHGPGRPSRANGM